MKYAMYLYNNCPHYNLGDSMQLIALENIYRQMGIDLDDVIRISWNELQHYDGEQVLLPIVSGLFGSFSSLSEKDQYSKKIIPIYISYVRFNPLSKDDAEYLKEYEPIGCRDEYTYRECTKFGIKSYINGCITASLPNRKDKPVNGNVFLVDAEPGLESYIPKIFIENAVRVSHIIRTDNKIDSLLIAKNYLNRYIQEANIVITKRLHCALPCAASGIPVIFARDQFTATLTFVDSLLNIYECADYSKINWNPEPYNFENIKSLIINTAVAKLTGNGKVPDSGIQLHNFYSKKQRDFSQYTVNIPFSHIDEKLSKLDTSFEYTFYGAGNELFTHYSYMKNHYPNAKLIAIFDKYAFGQIFAGIEVKPIDKIIEYLDVFCIVTAITKSTRTSMFDLLKSYGKPEETYV